MHKEKCIISFIKWVECNSSEETQDMTENASKLMKAVTLSFQETVKQLASIIVTSK